MTFVFSAMQFKHKLCIHFNWFDAAIHIENIQFIIIKITNNPFKCYITITYSFDLLIIYLLKFVFYKQNI